MPTMVINSWFLSFIHSALTFVLSVGSYWTSLASKFQFHNATKGLDWLPTSGYYTLPMADEMLPFSGMKTPLHLGILVLEDTYCLASIALVISLSYSIGTRYFSIYAKGLKPKDYIALEKRVAQLLSSKGTRKVNVDVQHILGLTNSFGHIHNSEQEKSSANVRIVNPGDGQKLLVDVTKHVAHLIKQGQVSRSDITPEYIDKLLQNKVGCPDPDLLLKFGTVPSICGYLPWQMRLTEMIWMPSLRGFNVQKMKRALMSFSKIEQRFGK